MWLRRSLGPKLALGIVALLFIPLPLSAQGLYGEYYNSRDFTGAPGATRIDPTIDFNFVGTSGGPTAVGFPPPLDSIDNSVRWQGVVQAPVTGQFTFNPNVTPNHDDGMRVWLNGRLIYDRWRFQGAGGAIVASDPINLISGQRYSIRVEYFQGGGDASVRLRWTYPGQTAQVIPATQLFPVVATPRIVPGTAAYSSSQLVTIISDHVGVTIHYTTDGSPPTALSPVYSGPFVVSSTTTVRAIAVKTGMLDSTEASATLTINDTAPPELSQVLAPQTSRRILAIFSEPVTTASANNVANYAVSGGLGITAASLDSDLRTVALTTSTDMMVNTSYILTVNNVQDLRGNAIPPNSQKVFTFRNVTSSLVHYWRLDEGFGTASVDDAGPASVTNITGTGNPWGKGKYLRAVHLNGVNNTLVLASSIKDDVDDSFTIAAWIMTEQRPQAKFGWSSPALLGQDSGNEQNEIFHAYVGDGGFFRITLPTPTSLPGAGSWVSSVSTSRVDTLVWTHVASQRDASAGVTRIFVNGVLQDQDAGSRTDANLLAPNVGGIMNLGCHVTSGGSVQFTSHWLGAFDELRIYNAAISASQIFDLANEPPLVDAGPDANAPFGSPFQLTATVTDTTMPSGGSLTYAWSQVSGPGTATFSNPSIEDPTVTFSQGGTYVLRLVASDGLLSASDDVTIIVERIAVTPLTLTTSEGGAPQSFNVVLSAPPSSDVVIPIASADTTEGTVSPTVLTFTPLNWNIPQPVTVTPVDDPIRDGNITYIISVGPASSSDPSFDAIDPPDVQVTNLDNDIPGFIVSTPMITVTEGGSPATFSVVLATQPSADVSITLTSTDTTEGTVSPTSLTFTSADWNTPQQVTVTPVDDPALDFTQSYAIVLGAATSGDADYNGLDPADVAARTLDNETIGDPDSAWGNCGTTGAEGLLALLVVALWRRRMRRA